MADLAHVAERLQGVFENQKDRQLHELFRESARAQMRAAEALKQLLCNFKDQERISAQIVEIEHEGDRLTDLIREGLSKIAITSWINQNSAMKLSNQLDSVMDGIRSMTCLFQIHNIQTVRPEALEFADLIIRIASEVKLLVELLACKNFRRNHNAIYQHIEAINKLEQDADALRKQALYQLWHGENGNAPLSLKEVCTTIGWDKVFETMESIADRAHQASNTVHRIMML